MQQFIREMNVRVTDAVGKMRALEAMKVQHSHQSKDVGGQGVVIQSPNKEIEDRIALQTKHLDRIDSEVKELVKYMSNYVTQQELSRELSDKITQQQMLDSLPDLEIFEQKIILQIQQSQEQSQEKFNVIFKNQDARIVELRKQFDVDAIMKVVIKKADGEQVNADLKNHEFKIQLLDKNLIHIASDFQLFQSAMSQINVSITEL